MEPNKPKTNRPAAARPNKAAATSPVSPDKRPALALSGARRWAFRVVALALVPLVVFGAAEFALRLAGYGYSPHFFLPAQVNGRSVRVDNPRFGWRFFPPAAARTPRPTLIPAAKPAGTYRILIFGESAAYGDPDAAFGLPRVLEVLLRDRFPATRFEVINAAMTAINSHAILPIARDGAREHGDIWVVYMGNNEVVGPYGAGTVFGPQAPSLAFIRASVALRSLRIGQALAAWNRRLRPPQAHDQSWGGMELFTAHQLRPDDPPMARVYAHFARNLSDLLDLGRQAGVKVVVSTVASNLKDCAPFASLHRADLTPSERAQWEQFYQAGIGSESATNLPVALACFQQAARLDATYADLQFRLARGNWLAGDFDAARRHFALARDYDALRFRADSRINDLIRAAARARGAAGVALVDGSRVLAEASPHQIPGEECFFEHVHLNFTGNYLLAKSLAQNLEPLLPAGTGRPPSAAPAWLSLEECRRRLALTDWDQYEVLEIVRQRMERPPFTFQLNHRDQYARLQQAAAEARARLTPTALKAAVDTYRSALAGALQDWTLHEKLARLLNRLGDTGGALEHWQRVAGLLPHYPTGWCQWGILLEQQGHPAEAIPYLQKALGLKPDFPEARNGLGKALADQRHWEAAVGQYERALRLKPDFAEARVNLGLVLQQQGKAAEAKAHFDEALRLQPENRAARTNVANLLNWQGQLSGAIADYAEELRQNPNDASAHYLLGRALQTQGRYMQARAQFAEAVRLRPGWAKAQCQLGFELARQGKDAEAMACFAEAIRLKPELAEAHLNLGVALARRQNFAEAITHFQEAVRQNPQDPTAKQYLQAAQARLRKGP